MAPDSIHCEQCSTRHVGRHKTKQFFHTMLSATVVADGHNRVLPLMPLFVQRTTPPPTGPPDRRPAQAGLRAQRCQALAARAHPRSAPLPAGPARAAICTAASPSAALVADLPGQGGADFLFKLAAQRPQDVIPGSPTRPPSGPLAGSAPATIASRSSPHRYQLRETTCRLRCRRRAP